MKLVDILARELREWPSCTRCILFDHANSCYADLGQGYTPLGIDCSDFDDDPSDKSCTTVYRAQWQAAVDALKAETWPRIGNEVQIQEGPATWTSEKNWIGRQATVIHIFKNRLDQKLALVEAGSGECSCFIVECMIPIRAPEQIAAEDREAKAKAMWQQIYFNTDPDYWDRVPEGTRDTFRAAIDAGWKKV